MFRRPGQMPLSVEQRQALVAVVGELSAAENHSPRLPPQVPELAALMSQAFVTPADHALLLDEVKAWTQWYRLPGYWLSCIAQRVTSAARSPMHPVACLLFGRSQLGHAAMDLGIDSIERGYLYLVRNQDTYGADTVQQTGEAFRLVLRALHNVLARTARPGPYADSNPVADNPYVVLTWPDLAAACPGLPLSGLCTEPQLDDAIRHCSGDDDMFGRIVARRHLGYVAAAAGDLESAVRHYEAALAEARSCGLDAEIGHLLRSLGHSQARLGRLQDALRTLSDAVRHDVHPLFSYWRGLDLRMLGTVWTRAVAAGSAEAMQPANEAFRDGRASLQAHAMLHQYLPVSRMATLQLARSSAGNAAQVAAGLAASADVIGECELNAPGDALDALVEVRDLQASGAEPAAAYLADREVFRRRYRNGSDDAGAYLEALAAEQPARGRYAQARLAMVSEFDQDEPASAVARLLAIDDPQAVFMHVMIGDGQLFVALVAKGRLITAGWAPVREAELQAMHRRYAEQLPDAELLARGVGREQAEAALDELLSGYARVLAPVLVPVLPELAGRHLKVFPRSFLTTVPLQALPIDGRRLIDICDVSYAQSVQLLVRAHERAARQPPADGPVTVVTGRDVPVYDAVAARLAAGGAQIMRDPAVADLADGTSSHPGTVLFACHGRYVPADPATSYLSFGPAGVTSLTSLFGRLRLDHAQTVIMGACESALGRAEISSEFVGMPNTFIAAGARYVIGSLWRVNQLASVALLDRYLQLAVPGASVVASFNQAQRDLAALTRENLQEWIGSALPDLADALAPIVARMPDLPYAHPRLWSGFCVQGDL
jgi:CHAT domain-containing protein